MEMDNPKVKKVEAAWQILECWAEGNDSTILETRKKVVGLLKSQVASDVDDIRDGFGERLWKAPDEL